LARSAAKIDAKTDALERKIDSRIGGLERRVSHDFRWIVGLFVGLMVALLTVSRH
jgi:hypothetical protein